MPLPMPHGAPQRHPPSISPRAAAEFREGVVERLVRDRTRRGQFAFAQEAKARLPLRPELLLGKSHRGLHIITLREENVALPVCLLREAYRGALLVDRIQRGEPVVEVRIGLELRYLERMRAALTRRGGNPTEEYVGAHYCVLRFDAPARRLLGLPLEIAKLTSGRATQQMIVSGYR